MTILLPDRLTVEDFKSFRQPSTLHLRPLTLIYGPNNVGKSALLRLLRLLSDATHEGPPGLPTSSPILRGARFRDLLHKPLRLDDDETPAQDFTFTLAWDHPDAALSTLALTFYEDPNPGPNRAAPLIVRRLVATPPGGQPATFLHRPEPPRDDDARVYIASLPNEPEARIALRFDGIVPQWEAQDLMGAPARSLLLDIADLLGHLHRSVDWLAGERAPLQRTYLAPTGRPASFRSDGSDAPDLLILHPSVEAACRAFFDAHLKRRLQLQPLDLPNERRFRILLGAQPSDGGPPRDTDLIDSGDGAGALLPTLVALERLRNPNLHTPFPFALLLEEPEAHLHPDLQLHLGAHIAHIAAQLGPRRLLIETHSEALLMGVRLAVARGDLSHEDVAVHWVRPFEDGEAHASRAPMNALGNLTGSWPVGAFQDLNAAAVDLMEQREAAHARHAG